MNKNSSANFLKGMGVGLAVGASVGMVMAPRKKSTSMVGKALKAAGEIAENISDAMIH